MKIEPQKFYKPYVAQCEPVTGEPFVKFWALKISHYMICLSTSACFCLPVGVSIPGTGSLGVLQTRKNSGITLPPQRQQKKYTLIIYLCVQFKTAFL